MVRRRPKASPKDQESDGQWPLELPQSAQADVPDVVVAAADAEARGGEAPNTRLPSGIVFLLAPGPGPGAICIIHSFPCLDVVHEQRGNRF